MTNASAVVLLFLFAAAFLNSCTGEDARAAAPVTLLDLR